MKTTNEKDLRILKIIVKVCVVITALVAIFGTGIAINTVLGLVVWSAALVSVVGVLVPLEKIVNFMNEDED